MTRLLEPDEPTEPTQGTTHEIGTPRCAVCGNDTRQPISMRLWDDLIEQELEADVCSGDCAKAWIDGVAEIDAEAEAELKALDEQAHPRWVRSVAVADGKHIRYCASIVGEPDSDPFADPARAAELDARARADYAAHMTEQADEQAHEQAMRELVAQQTARPAPAEEPAEEPAESEAQA